eukprot:TRINITY_DN16349_c0_g1_i1.p1 TRINITY_DN16349_c0_g1~~TRINITY_DN16349_c0_g1_i1.p1  ORF type:complete len:275 (-),score=128.99 TRINITY_DN16349_c0_g1_i1:19-843(-)
MSAICERFSAWEATFTRRNGGEAFFVAHEPQMLALAAAYLAFVFLAPRVMASRAALVLKYPLAAWNFFLFAATVAMARRVVPALASELVRAGPHAALCSAALLETPPAAIMVAAFCLSKGPELVDTVFIVLRKKPLVLLQWVHHVLTMIYSYYSYQYNSSLGVAFAAMNLIVHTPMYFYFFVAALEIKATRPVLRAVAPFITAIQIVQMVVGLGLCLYAMYLAHYTDLVCETPYWLASSGAAMYFLYFVLFAMFFAKKYSAKDKKDASKKPKRA